MERNYKKWLDKINAKQDKLQNTTYNIGVGKKDAIATERLDVNGNIKAKGFKTPTGTSTQALTADGGVFDLSAIAGNGESSNSLVEVTYNELLNLKNTSSLVKGQNYLLTDYETTYIQPLTGINKNSGVIEPLIITATDVNKLHNQCKSTLYPQDIVFYEITGDINDGYGTEGFTKGKIYRRIDTLRNNDIGTDWRHVKYKKDSVEKLLFENYTNVYHNKIETYSLFNSTSGSNFCYNTIGNGFFNNRIGNDFSNNTIGNDFSTNTIADGFTGNIIGYYFYYNTIGDGFSDNIIKDNFTGNTGLYYFRRNKVEEYFSENTIGNGFSGNIIGDNFISNIIGDDFGGNITIRSGFQENGNSETPFVSQNTEFIGFMNNITSSTEIENRDIDVVVFKSPNGTVKQRYYDDSNNLVINNL